MIFMLIFVLDFEEFSAPATNGSARYKRFRRKGVIKLPLADFRYFGAENFMYLIGTKKMSQAHLFGRFPQNVRTNVRCIN